MNVRGLTVDIGKKNARHELNAGKAQPLYDQ